VKLGRFTFPNTSRGSNAFVQFHCSESLSNVDLLFLDVGGSMLTFIVGVLLFIVVYNRKLHPIFETFLGFYSLMLLGDFIIYNFADVFFLQFGDWYSIYLIAPYLNGIFIFLSIALFMIFRVHHRKMADHIVLI
jgi:branched-subunit amino acid transport protein